MLLNPNTRTCPVFRTSVDADLTRAIYRRVPVLVDQRNGVNPWGVEFLRMFDMANDSGLFHNVPATGRLPLYEAKLFHQFSHRWATYEHGEAHDTTPAQLADPAFRITPRYWVRQAEVEERLHGRWDRGWLLGWRRIARNTDERTFVCTVFPRLGMGDSVFLLLANAATGRPAPALVACLNSLLFDYVARQKIGGTNASFYFVNQFPVPPPSAYDPTDLDFIVPRVLELTYTAHDLTPFARDCGYDGPPFRWEEDRRALLRAELDAYYAALYGLTRDELRYVLDPQNVYGPNFPGETFRVLKEREKREYGGYRTGRLVLEAWDRLGLQPRNRDGRYHAGAPPELPSPRRGAMAETPSAGVSTRGSAARAAPPSPTPSASASGPTAPTGKPSTGRVSALSARGPLPKQTVHEVPIRYVGSPVQMDERHPAPGTQSTLPGLASPEQQMRQRVLTRALETLRIVGPLSARDLAARLTPLDPRINKHVVNSVLFREGKALVRHDQASARFRIR